jgi:phosphatidylglycerophosphate synthase
MKEPTFGEAQRVTTSLLNQVERRTLVWLAARLPRWINSDHLTVLALVAMLLTGVSYFAARFSRFALFGAVLGLALNWFGDSLDGTLARVRNQQRPRYGFYVDHVVDCFGVLFVVAGLGLSGFMSGPVAMALLIAYFMLSIEIYLATYSLALFRLSFWAIGPTELRIILAIGTLALLTDPRVEILGGSYRLFDVGGIVAIASLALVLVISAIRNTRALYLAEPLPENKVNVGPADGRDPQASYRGGDRRAPEVA